MPLNLFGPSSASQDAINYVFGTTYLQVTNNVSDVLAHIGGKMFALPASDVVVSATGQYCTNSFAEWSSANPTDLANCTSLRLRATISRDIRAPTLFDLYQPTTAAPNSSADFLINTLPNAPQTTSGNASLKAEVGHTQTIGGVYAPKFLRGLSITLDWYHIKLNNAILNVNSFAQNFQTACYTSGGSSPYCALQTWALGSYTNTSAANYVMQWYS